MHLAAVHAMLQALSGQVPPDNGFCQRHQGWNYQHWMAGRARICNVYLLCAAGSGDVLGPGFAASTVYEHPAGNFTTLACGH